MPHAGNAQSLPRRKHKWHDTFAKFVRLRSPARAWWRWLRPRACAPRTPALVQGDDPYFKQAQGALQNILKLQDNTNRAKNVILIVGDGMGFSTVTATRIFEGQQRGVDGESNVLAWEAFPAPRRLEDLFLRRADHRFRAERRRDDGRA